MEFLTGMIKCTNDDMDKPCPMHAVYKDYVKRALLKDKTKKFELTKYQLSKLAITCATCPESLVLLTEPGIRRAQRGFKPVGETIDDFVEGE